MNLDYYRLYFLTAENQIFRFVELDCESDQMAADQAAKLLHAHPIEIWRRGRRVRRLDPSTDPQQEPASRALRKHRRQNG